MDDLGAHAAEELALLVGAAVAGDADAVAREHGDLLAEVPHPLHVPMVTVARFGSVSTSCTDAARCPPRQGWVRERFVSERQHVASRPVAPSSSVVLGRETFRARGGGRLRSWPGPGRTPPVPGARLPFPLIEARAAEADAASAKVALAQTSMLRLARAGGRRRRAAGSGGAADAAGDGVAHRRRQRPRDADAGARARTWHRPVRGHRCRAVPVDGASRWCGACAREGVDLGDATLVAPHVACSATWRGRSPSPTLADAVGVDRPRGCASSSNGHSASLAIDLVAAERAGAARSLSVLCSAVLCVGLWLASRARGPSRGRQLLLLWAAAGVATAFGLEVCRWSGLRSCRSGALSDVAVWGDVSRHLAATVPGTLVGAGSSWP